jgi:hypothetical protein
MVIQIKTFASSVISQFTVSMADTQVAMVVYNTEVRLTWPLNKYENIGALQTAIMGIPYTTGITNSAA